ncbi:MCM2/3/5 family-domain-containing protein [Cokeromyces recurvatus]|uniref:MCM2/3/5 family-domain-containing protein n=1 Tax=Cokeromyces recurvatus TaxID=90255 RepID=UPI002220E166|nr:MCM2/3/5 family-domain-containing protein [Cokeromyces recurvatus]KAI7902611.1 MCM2/3/5 family-domain-containing protein [Cokeromyces recurvatus]
MTDFASDHLFSGILGSQVAPLASDTQGQTPMNMDIDDTQATRTQRRPGYDPDNIPRVIDETAMAVMETFEKFIETFKDDQSSYVSNSTSSWYGYPYMMQLENFKYSEIDTLFVDFSHIEATEESLAIAIKEQYYRFLPYLRRAIHNVARNHFPDSLFINEPTLRSAQGETFRNFTVAFYGLNDLNRVRQLRTDKIGHLVSVSGTVTRTTEVRPELVYASFTCNECGKVMNDVEQEFRYTEPTMCQTSTCYNRSHWTLNVEQSKFVDWQRIRIQENANEIPTGSMPRSMDVIVRNDMVERAKAGDKCIFTGTLIVVPDVAAFRTPGTSVETQRDTKVRSTEGIANEGVTGLKALGVRDLTYKLSFLACMVQPANHSKGNGSNNLHGEDTTDEDQRDVYADFSQKEIEDLHRMVNMGGSLFGKLVNSIAPTVFGHETVKKGILLQLMGGVHKVTPEGMNLRGDINVCIVGDPSTSKSQFLKYVCSIMPRAVYTSGKASSAAGLTASVIKDEETGEFSIEAGALMLADNGICAIDEFDKMDIKDQVAIHEAMEQQTISIAKAGIQASLNARTSILAAANPVSGRYNKKLTLRQNINMSAPIMSRFDLFFVVLDECNDITDYNIGRHIVNTHRLRDDFMQPEFSTEQIQNYIRYARTFKPKMTPAAALRLADCYRDLRQGDSQGIGRNSYRITVRQLESMIRLSEAIARVNCREEITEAYVTEAFNLLQKSIIRVEEEDVNIDDEMNEEQDDVMTSAEALNGMTLNDTADQHVGNSAIPPSGKISITYEKFEQIKLMLAHKLRLVQQSFDEDPGMRRSELIMWYLEQREADMTAEDLDYETLLINKIIKKLVKTDETLIEIRQDDSEEELDDPIIMLHPNCILADEE